jgi:adenylosuccinate lyase
MKTNLERTRGMIFSEGVLLQLVQKGLSREEAYALVQKAAFQVGGGKRQFEKVLLKDRAILKYLTAKEIRECLDLKHTLRHVDTLFRRVFGRRKNK